MTRSLLFVSLAACASNNAPRTEVAIAPPPSSSASTEPVHVAASPDAGSSDDDLLNTMMNGNAGPNTEEDALLVQMMMQPKNVQHGPPVVHVSSDTSEIAGQRVVIRRIVRQNYAHFRACYEKGLATKPDLGGRVVVHFKIESSGKVTGTRSTGATTLPSPDVVACVVDAFKPLVFPERGGALVVDYPVVFAQ